MLHNIVRFPEMLYILEQPMLCDIRSMSGRTSRGRTCRNMFARYPYAMTGKIIGGLIIIILIAGGAYWYMTQDSTAPADTTTTQEQTTPQVAGQDAVIGTGETAAPGSRVEILYVGMLQDGTVFDSSANNNNQPLAFTLGEPGIIPGFQIGVNGMKVGGERRVSIPPELGYGAQDVKDADGKVIIPANSTLIFDIKLVKATAGTSTPATGTTTSAN